MFEVDETIGVVVIFNANSVVFTLKNIKIIIFNER